VLNGPCRSCDHDEKSEQALESALSPISTGIAITICVKKDTCQSREVRMIGNDMIIKYDDNEFDND
jgi:hypothetical protein